MSVNANELTEYSWDDIKKCAKQAIMSGLLTQNISAAGKTITFGSVAEARNTYKWAVDMQASEMGNDGGFAFLIAK